MGRLLAAATFSLALAALAALAVLLALAIFAALARGAILAAFAAFAFLAAGTFFGIGLLGAASTAIAGQFQLIDPSQVHGDHRPRPDGDSQNQSENESNLLHHKTSDGVSARKDIPPRNAFQNGLSLIFRTGPARSIRPSTPRHSEDIRWFISPPLGLTVERQQHQGLFRSRKWRKGFLKHWFMLDPGHNGLGTWRRRLGGKRGPTGQVAQHNGNHGCGNHCGPEHPCAAGGGVGLCAACLNQVAGHQVSGRFRQFQGCQLSS